ncbi:hypothetical protein EIP91_004095 [Steccherinum ochraceum]|uniref:Uncharacterized protein n=1 Tax=Steccherinum ochraceum TaxID=92696 RepID=A0A4R0RPT6_9APHY|nr:hypothetical protein EIP91_004095 [Steccherinum ochraceum]
MGSSSPTPTAAKARASMLHSNLPAFVFLSLSALGFYTIIVHMFASHAPERFLEVHKASKVPLSVSAGYLPALDAILTPLVSFFVSAFGDTTSSAYAITANFVWSFSAPIQLPLIEGLRVRSGATRSDKGDSAGERASNGGGIAVKLLQYPMIWGMLYQRLSGGWIIPLWLLTFLYASPQRSVDVRAGKTTGVSRIDAESVFVGWWIGHTIPALLMLVPRSPPLERPPIWMAFPILMSLCQWIYKEVRTRLTSVRRTPQHEEGYVFLQLTYASVLLISFASHIHLVIIPALASSDTSSSLLQKVVPSLRYFQDFFVSATGFAVPAIASTTAASAVRDFVQWDTIVVFISVWIAVVWDLARWEENAGKRQRLSRTNEWFSYSQLLLILVLASVGMGPGSVTAALMLYRESLLYHAM